MAAASHFALDFDDLTCLAASKSMIKAGLKRIFRSGYVWDVHLQADGSVEGCVESDHKATLAYKVCVRIGSHRLESHSCTCIVKRTMICKHVVALLCGAIVLINNIMEHPKWLPRYPNYKTWPETIVKHLSVRNFEEVRGHLASQLPSKFRLQTRKTRKTGRVKRSLVDPVVLNRKRPRDVRAEVPEGAKRKRQAPARFAAED